MLLQFSFKNFKSFKDEAILDLTVQKKDDTSDHFFSLGDELVLPVTAVYGANASGKSNLYQAFAYMTRYVVLSFMYGDESNNDKYAPTPFLFDNESAKEDSYFETHFSIPNSESETVYNYGFCVNRHKVTEEWLNKKDKNSDEYSLVFYRGGEHNELDLSGIPDDSQQNIKVALEDQVLIVSLGAKLKIDECKVIRDWFLANELTDFANPLTNMIMTKMLPEHFIESKEEQRRVVDFLASFDGHIEDFKIDEVEKDNSERKAYKISTLHKINNTSEMAEIPLRDESAGTLKMFSLYPQLKKVIEKGSVFFIDELNARLHPLLVRNILITFINPQINVNHAQLVFTAHDTWQLANHILEKEEVWFVEKGEEGRSQLYSLADFSGLDDFNQDDYLLGKYGAVPELKKMEFKK